MKSMQVQTVQSALPVSSCIVKPFTGSCVLNQSRAKWCTRSFKDNDSHLSNEFKSHFNGLEETRIFSQFRIYLEKLKPTSTQKKLVILTDGQVVK